MREVRVSGARRVLEFGPGISTLAFLEAGCDVIETCEHTREWRDKARAQFRKWAQVCVREYINSADVAVRDLPRGRFDLAFVDSPVGEGKRRVPLAGQENCNRLNTVLFALDRADVVLLHDARRQGEQETLVRIANLGHRVEMIATKKGIARIRKQ